METRGHGARTKDARCVPTIPPEWEGFEIKIELRGERLVIAAHSATVEADGRIRLADCAVARLASAPERARPTTIRSAHAVLTLATPARSIMDLKTGTIRIVEFADGLRMNLKEQ